MTQREIQIALQPNASNMVLMKTYSLLRLGLALLLIVNVGHLRAQDQKPANTIAVEVPAAVKTALQKEADGGRIVELGRVNEDGRQQYEAVVSREGLEYRIRVSLLGVVLHVELKDYNGGEDQSLSQLPAVVRDSFKKLARGGNVENSRRQRLAYSFETQIDGKRYAITTDEQGRLLKKELQQDESENK